MKSNSKLMKIGLTAGLVVLISVLHMKTPQGHERVHLIYRELYFFPLILNACWFGLRGALLTSAAITICYLPFTVYHWNEFSPKDLDRLVEIGLFNVVAAGMGIMRDREIKKQREKREAVMALAGAVAHEINTPLFTALGTAQLLQDDYDKESGPHGDLNVIIGALKKVKRLVRKIAGIEDVVMNTYTGHDQVADIEESAADSCHNDFVDSGSVENRTYNSELPKINCSFLLRKIRSSFTMRVKL
jgi:two-component system sensor histidine kinase HydH